MLTVTCDFPDLRQRDSMTGSFVLLSPVPRAAHVVDEHVIRMLSSVFCLLLSATWPAHTGQTGGALDICVLSASRSCELFCNPDLDFRIRVLLRHYAIWIPTVLEHGLCQKQSSQQGAAPQLKCSCRLFYGESVHFVVL